VSGRVRGGDARHRRRGMRRVVYERGSCIRGPLRGGSSASAARWLRRTRPNAERRRLDTGGRPCTRVIRRGYPSIRRPETESDLRMRGWGLDMYPPQPRFRRKFRTVFRTATDAYPPDHPRELNHKKVTKLNDAMREYAHLRCSEPSGRGLAARMKPCVDVDEFAVIDVGVDLRGGNVGMSEHLLDRANLCAMRQQMGGKAVA
jgi:hypothetical protein